MVEELGSGLKKRLLQHQINHYLARLARTQNEEEFYNEFDIILRGVHRFAGPNKSAIENVRRAFQSRHSLADLSRLLLQERMSKVTRERLAENFFCDWVMEAGKRERLEEEGFKAPWFFVISPTNACNLNCYGCYAREYEKGEGLSYATFDRILREGESF